MLQLYPIIAETLKEDGLDAGLNHNGFNVCLKEGDSNYSLFVAGGDIVITKHSNNVILFQGPLADPDIFTKVKIWLKNS